MPPVDPASQNWAHAYLKTLAEQPDTPADDEDMTKINWQNRAAPGDVYKRTVCYPRMRLRSNAPVIFPPPPEE